MIKPPHRFYVPSPREASRLAGYRCPRCNVAMVKTSRTPNPRAPSIDHILPKVRGGRMFIHGDVRNWRLLCCGCNNFLAICGHCPGAVAAVKAVATDKVQHRRAVASAWRMHALAMQTDGVGGAHLNKPAHRLVHQDSAPTPTMADVWGG